MLSKSGALSCLELWRASYQLLAIGPFGRSKPMMQVRGA
jgi:hypothetical protein